MKKFMFALLMFAVATVAQAGSVITFTDSNFSNPSVTPPYATVVVTENTTLGQLTFNVSIANGNPAKLGEFGFNLAPSVNFSDFTMSSFTGNGGDTSAWSLMPGGTMDGFGSFSAEVGPSDNGAANRLTDYSFTLQFAPGKFGEATVADINVLNSSGNLAALEYFPNTGNTGFVVGSNDMTPGTTGTTPEPATMTLAAIGAAGFGLYQWRKRRKPV